MPLARGRDPICAECSSSRNRQPFRPPICGQEGCTHSIHNQLLFMLRYKLLQLLQRKGHHFSEGLDVREAVWVWQFLWLDNRNSGHLPVCSGALGAWPDGNASEEYQTQSYFCLSSGSALDGSQGLPESPAVLPTHLNTSTHTLKQVTVGFVSQFWKMVPLAL